MTKFNAEHGEASAIRELTADELDFVSGGKMTVKPKEEPQPYLVLTMQDCLVTSV